MIKMIVKGGLHPVPGFPRVRHDHMPTVSGVILSKVMALLFIFFFHLVVACVRELFKYV